MTPGWGVLLGVVSWVACLVGDTAFSGEASQEISYVPIARSLC